MIQTQLILIEGPPGSGKSTTAQKISDAVAKTGIACQCFFEWSPHHPIPIGDDFHLGQVISTSIAREEDVLRQWQRFSLIRHANQGVTIMESRFWQTSVLLMYVAGHPAEGVIESNRRVIDAITALNPVLIYLVVDDLKTLVERTIQDKNAEWLLARYPGSWSNHIFEAFESQKWFTERGLTGPVGIVALLEAWAKVSEQLYDQLPFPKIKIRNPYLNWSLAMQQIYAFLGLPT